MGIFQRYVSPLPKKPKQLHNHNSHHALPSLLIQHLQKTFNITHSYFSSPLTYNTHFKNYHSPYTRDKIFGSLGPAFETKWAGIGYAHPPDYQSTIQAIHWARLAAQQNSNNITIITLPDPHWHSTTNTTTNSYQNTHTIIYFKPNTLQYETHTSLPEYYNIIEPLATKILCIYHKNQAITPLDFPTSTKNLIQTSLKITCSTNTPQHQSQNTPPMDQRRSPPANQPTTAHIFNLTQLSHPTPPQIPPRTKLLYRWLLHPTIQRSRPRQRRHSRLRNIRT